MSGAFRGRRLRASAWVSKRRRGLSRGYRTQRRAYARLRQRFYEGLWVKVAEEVGAEARPLGNGFIRIERDDQFTFVRQSSLNIDPFVSLGITSDKPTSHRLLSGTVDGYAAPAYEEFTLDSLVLALDFLKKNEDGVVVKPAAGTGAGAGITASIRSTSDLYRGIARAREYGSRMMIESFYPGHSYRLVFFDGSLLQAVRRDPPTIVGDGRSDVRELVAQENARRLAAKPFASLNPLEIDLDCVLRLGADGLAPKSVPERDMVVTLKYVVNQNAARENHVESPDVHPSILELGAALSAELNLRLFGLDLIASSLQQDVKSGAIVTDINATPGLHHHYLVADAPPSPSIAAVLIERLLAESRAQGFAHRTGSPR